MLNFGILRRIGWKSVPGSLLPDPILLDDSALFSPEMVKNVRAWLNASQEQFKDAGPTPIFVQLGRDGAGFVDYCVGEGVKECGMRWRHCTVEVFERFNNGAPGMKWQYIAARNERNQLIVGPRLEVKQVQALDALCLTN